MLGALQIMLVRNASVDIDIYMFRPSACVASKNIDRRNESFKSTRVSYAMGTFCRVCRFWESW
jgi:hypothetical protein